MILGMGPHILAALLTVPAHRHTEARTLGVRDIRTSTQLPRTRSTRGIHLGPPAQLSPWILRQPSCLGAIDVIFVPAYLDLGKWVRYAGLNLGQGMEYVLKACPAGRLTPRPPIQRKSLQMAYAVCGFTSRAEHLRSSQGWATGMLPPTPHMS